MGMEEKQWWLFAASPTFLRRSSSASSRAPQQVIQLLTTCTSLCGLSTAMLLWDLHGWRSSLSPPTGFLRAVLDASWPSCRHHPSSVTPLLVWCSLFFSRRNGDQSSKLQLSSRLFSWSQCCSSAANRRPPTKKASR